LTLRIYVKNYCIYNYNYSTYCEYNTKNNCVTFWCNLSTWRYRKNNIV